VGRSGISLGRPPIDFGHSTYTSPPVPEEVDLATASTTALLKRGIPFRKPVDGDRPALHDAWNLAGDTMSCAVSYIGNKAGVINFANQTTGQKFSVTLAPPVGATFSGETVEWIMEAPDGRIPTSSLPKFTTINFVAAFGCDTTGKLAANPKNGDTVNIISGKKTLTSTTVANDAVTISFTG
jgi:Peptidase A4 family